MLRLQLVFRKEPQFPLASNELSRRHVEPVARHEIQQIQDLRIAVDFRPIVQEQEIWRADPREQGIVRGGLAFLARQPKIIGLLAGSRLDPIVGPNTFIVG